MNMTQQEADAVFEKNVGKWVNSSRRKFRDYLAAGLSADWEYPDLCQEARIAAWKATRKYAETGDPERANLNTYVLGAIKRHMAMVVSRILAKCRTPHMAVDFPALDGSKTWHFNPAPVILYDESLSDRSYIDGPGLYINCDSKEGYFSQSVLDHIEERVPTPEQYMLQQEDELVAKAIRLKVLSVLDERERRVLLARAFPPESVVDMEDWNNVKLAHHLGLTLNQVNYSLLKIRQTIIDVVDMGK